MAAILPVMSARRYPWQIVDRSTYPDMNYLLSEGARARYVLAAHYVRDQPQIVEIGGFKTPITAFLTCVPQRVLVVDPLISEYRGDELHGEPCRIEHLATTFQRHTFDLEPGAYGLVLLGASMKHFSRDSALRQREWEKLLTLTDNAAVAVLEFAVEWQLGQDNIARIVDDTRLEVVMQADLDLRHSPGMDGEHHQRRIMVLAAAADPRGHG